MSAERDSGLQALQQGNFAQAVSLLEAACAGNPNDFEALLYLGAAYGQSGRQLDAINSITRAVQLQPANAQARYNLGIAMEQGGYREQAIQALQQALTLQPDYPRAQESLRRLQGDAVPAVSVPAPPPVQNPGPSYAAPQGAGAGPDASLPQFGIGQVDDSLQTPASYAPTAYGAPVQPPAYGAPPPQPAYGSPYQPQQAPPAYGSPYPSAPGSPVQPQNAPVYGAPPPAAGYNQPAQTPLPYGQQPGPYTPPASAIPYGAPSALPSGGSLYSPPGAMPPYGAGQLPGREIRPDTFDIAQAFKDMGRVLTGPRAFFQEQAGGYGMKAPMALFLVYMILIGITTAMQFAHLGAIPGANPQALQFLTSAGPLMIAAIAVLFYAVMFFLYAGLVHLSGLLFSNSAPFSASFRAVVYAYSPLILISLIGAAITFMAGPSASPLTALLGLAGIIWYVVLLVMAISECQQISGGAAFGVVVVSLIASLVAFFVICFTIGIVIGVMAAGAAHGGRGLILPGG